MNSEKAKLFPLPKDSPAWQDTKRTLIGLYKQGPLETVDHFAGRIVREFQEYQRRTNTTKLSEKVLAFDKAKPRILGVPLKLLRKFAVSF